MKYLLLLIFCLPISAEETPYVGTVIGWKFNHTPGMSTRAGEITGFPATVTDRDGNVRTGGIPTQAEIDQWTAEFIASNPTGKIVIKSETDKLNDKINMLLTILGVVGTAAIGKAAYDKLKSDTEKA